MIYCAFPLAQYQSHQEEILSAVARVLESGHYILGPEVTSFEDSFASYCGAAHAVGVNSGTDALTLSLRAMGIGPGDEVITVSMTAIATVSAIIACGATPVLVDVDPVYYTICPDAFAGMITEKTKAVIPVHLYGQPADMDAIMLVANQYKLYVIEDCAQSVGALYNGKRVGSIGDVGCFSFYPTKNLGAIGDGGAVVTRNSDLNDRILRQRQYGWNNDRITEEPGLNTRLDEIQAAILNVKLKYIDDDNERRALIAGLYEQGLQEHDLGLPKAKPNSSHVYHLYVITAPRRDELANQLRDKGIGTGVHYGAAAHEHRGYDNLCRLPDNGLPNTERLVSSILSLPMYPELSHGEVQTIISSIGQI